MSAIDSAADLSIRRACGFAGLGIGCVMLALSYDPGLSFRMGAQLVALLCLGLGIAAWRAPRRDLRHSELWALLRQDADSPVRTLPRDAAQAVLATVLRRRLLWHAERVGLAAIGLWMIAALFWLITPG